MSNYKFCDRIILGDYMKWVVSSEMINKCFDKSLYPKDKLIKGYVLALLDSYSYDGRVAIISGNNEKGLIGKELSLKLDNSDLFVTRDYKNKDDSVIIIDENTSFDDYDIIVDALLDNNFKGIVDEYNSMIINKINSSGKKVISIDLNSGLNFDSGLGSCIVKSDLTVSLNNYKYGHFINMAKDNIKDKVNYRFGVDIDTNCHLLEKTDFDDLLDDRANFSNKYDYGVVCIMGGSNDFSGAIKLANMSAASIRSGVGVSRLAVPANMAQSVLSHIVESTVVTIESKFGQMVYNENDLKKALHRTNCLVIDMGWGSSREYSKILNYIIKNYDKPIVIDADGINTLKDMDLSLLKTYEHNIIITPHLREFSRISKMDTNKILENPVKAVEKFASKWGITVLLKGPTSIVSDGEATYLIDRGCSGMATAGSGDVLSGILGGLLAWNEYDLKLVAKAAFINGFAGEEAQKEFGSISMMASDTINKIPVVLNKLKEFNKKEK